MPILETEDLTKIYYYNSYCIRAITNCNLRIEQGEFVVITGVRGSGKTTLLRMLGGYDRPSSGSVYLDHRDIYSLNDAELANIYRHEIGFIFQDYQLIQSLTVYDNILMPSLLNNSVCDKDYLAELTEALHINDILHCYPKKISEEQQQCVAIARALINQPEIILADEPTKNINNRLSEDILGLLLNYISWYHRTLIMVTRDPVISISADHLINLNLGRIVNDRIVNKKKEEVRCR